MRDLIEIGGLYKIKKDKHLCRREEILSPYVRLCGCYPNPAENNELYVRFFYTYKHNLNSVEDSINMKKILKLEQFLEYFELDLTRKQVTLKYFIQNSTFK